MKFWGMFKYTIEETLRKGTLIFYFIVGNILLLLVLGIGKSPDDPNIITLFGNPITLSSTKEFNAIEFLLIMSHQLSVGAILLFGVLGISDTIPSMLNKGTIDLFLSKPLSRWELLMARSIGSVSGVAINLLYFFLGIWLILGLRINVWHWGFLLSGFVAIYILFCYFSIVVLVGLITRNTVLTMVFAFLYQAISWLLEIRERGLYYIWDNVIYHRIIDAIYYATPQLHAMLENSTYVIGKMPFAQNVVEFNILPFIYSFFSTALIYIFSIYFFSRQDY